MLRALQELPADSSGCYHDELTGQVFTASDGRLLCLGPSGHKQYVPIPDSFAPCSEGQDKNGQQVRYSQPEDYLPRLKQVYGKGLINTEGTIASSQSSSDHYMVRSTVPLRNRSCWQFHAPTSLYSLQLGACKCFPNGQVSEIMFSFNSSTPRTVTFLADNCKIKAWVNKSAAKTSAVKEVDYELQNWYPCVKIKEKGATVIFNPFAAEPNTTISNINPFNTHTAGSIPHAKAKQLKEPVHATIIGVRQINEDQMLLLDDKNRVKSVLRNPESLAFELDCYSFCQNSTIYQLITAEEWAKIVQLGTHCQLKISDLLEGFTNEIVGFQIQDILQVIRYLIIEIDRSVQCRNHPDYFSVMEILIRKLVILRPFAHQSFPNPIMASQIDRAAHHYSSTFFDCGQDGDLIQASGDLLANNGTWFRLKGRLVELTTNYICTLDTSCQDEEYHGQINMYLISNVGFKRVFTTKVNHENGVEFNKQSFISQCLASEPKKATSLASLWEENHKGPHIYKLLEGCFNADRDIPINVEIYQPKEQDIRELVQDYKINETDAITALEECITTQQALAWLANPQRKRHRKPKKPCKQSTDSQNISTQYLNQIHILQIAKSDQICRIMLLIRRKIYMIGIDPRSLLETYLTKTEKGLINLSTFAYSLSICGTDCSNWYSYMNHCQLSILDSLDLDSQTNSLNFIKNNDVQDLYILPATNDIILTYTDEQILMKTSLTIRQEKIYNVNDNCFVIHDEPTQFDESEFVDKDKVIKLVTGEYYVLDQKQSMKYHGNWSWISNGRLYSTIDMSLKQPENCNRVLNLQLRQQLFGGSGGESMEGLADGIEQIVEVSQETEDEQNKKFLPMLVERGPPGCNMNYPICSILYPRAPIPFLANYPYSLTFRNLHGKYMKVCEVVIERIGNKKNTNQIKQGYIYFSNCPTAPLTDSDDQSDSRTSKKYYFAFGCTLNSMKVGIDEHVYWKYMIIQPKYSEGKKLPYEIGFVGARGKSIDAGIYQSQVLAKMEQALEIQRDSQVCRYDILRFKQSIDGIVHVSLRVTHDKEGSVSNLRYGIKCPSFSVLKQSCRSETVKDRSLCNWHSETCEYKVHKTVELDGQQLLKILRTPPTTVKNPTKFTSQILKELAKNEKTNFSQFTDSQIRKFIDLWLINKQISTRTFSSVMRKVLNQSQAGKRYLDEIWDSMGTGPFVLYQKHLPCVLWHLVGTDQQKVQQILCHAIDKLSNPKIRNPFYDTLYHEFNTPYLLLQRNLYSPYYYKKIVTYLDKLQHSQGDGSPTQSCQDIYQQENLLTDYEFAIVKESNIKKICVKIGNEGSSIKNIVLRFDRSQLHSKAIISVYSYEMQNRRPVKLLRSRNLIQEHQWIQITKNPYRQEMLEMFNNNKQWLNAYAITLDERVQLKYLEIEILSTVMGMNADKKEMESIPRVEIIPEIYGQKLKSGLVLPQIGTLDETYFTIKEQEKFFIAKIPLHLQLSATNSLNGKNMTLDKYLVNKSKSLEFNYFRVDDSINKNSQSNISQTMAEYSRNVLQLIDQMKTMPKSLQSFKIKGLTEQHKIIMDSIWEDNSVISYRTVDSLDYYYTVIMRLLETMQARNMQVSEKTASILVESLIKHQTGPVSVAAFKAILHHPTMILRSLEHITIVQKLSETESSANSVISNQLNINNFCEKVSLDDLSNTISIAQSYKSTNTQRYAKMTSSLLNLLVQSEVTPDYIAKCLPILSNQQHHAKFLDFFLNIKSQQSKTAFLIVQTEQKITKIIVEYFYLIVDQNQGSFETSYLSKLITKLANQELQALLLQSKKSITDHNLINADKIVEAMKFILHSLLSSENLSTISLETVSLLLTLNLPSSTQWHYLQKCVKLCSNAQEMIFTKYLSMSRASPTELMELAIFHREILHEAAKSQKHSQLLVTFLKEVLSCNRALFVNIIMSLPYSKEDSHSVVLHSDIYETIITMILEECDVGGVQGAILLTFEQNLSLSVVNKLLKLAPKQVYDGLTASTTTSLIKWYLLNNGYQMSVSNPINRSPAVNNIIEISDRVLELLLIHTRAGHNLLDISKILHIFEEVKQHIRGDDRRLLSSKYIMLSRLKFGITKLVENSINQQSLMQLLNNKTNDKSSKTMFEAMIEALEQEQSKYLTANGQHQQFSQWKEQHRKQRELIESFDGFVPNLHAGKKQYVNLNVKDWTANKGGSKSFICKISVSNPRMILRKGELKKGDPEIQLNLSKFVIGMCVQQNPQKNVILPDCIELYGSTNKQNERWVKISDLHVIDDQNFYQSGIKLFGINFNNLRYRVRNSQQFNALELRFKTLVLPSCSDVLENYQKTLKNAIYQISFVSITGCGKEPVQYPSYMDIYMQILSFLSRPQYTSVVKALINRYQNENSAIFKRLISVLNYKAKLAQPTESTIQDILFVLASHGVNVLAELVSMSSADSKLLSKILKNNSSVESIDMILENLCSNSDESGPLFSEDGINFIVDNIKMLSYSQYLQTDKKKCSKFNSLQKLESLIIKFKNKCQAESQKQNQYARILACIFTTPNIFDLPLPAITDQLMQPSQNYTLYPIVASYVNSSIQTLNTLLQNGKVLSICQDLFTKMRKFKYLAETGTSNPTLTHNINNLIYLISSLVTYDPIRRKIIRNQSDKQLDKFPIKVFKQLSNDQKLLEEYPKHTQSYFISFFQSTCTNPSESDEQSCAQDFAKQLINLMVKLPDIPSQYHNNFIYDFFFPLINAYDGILVNFLWKDSSQNKYLDKATAILETKPIRPNRNFIEFNNQYHTRVTSNWGQILKNKAVIEHGDRIIATKQQNSDVWAIVNKQQSEATEYKLESIKAYFVENKEEEIQVKQWQLFINGSSEPCPVCKTPKIQGEQPAYRIYITQTDSSLEFSKLLTNQTLQRMKSPAVFGQNYLSISPARNGMLGHLYMIPLEITCQEILKEINLCGYRLDQSALEKVTVNQVIISEDSKMSRRPIHLEDQFSKFVKSGEGARCKPIIDIEIEAHDLFRNTTIQDIANQSGQRHTQTFIAQETVFKAFQRLKGLQKMIRVMMTCVKNWKNSQRSKNWLQYLNQLESCSCFPVFSAIYMKKQENVQLLFNILSGLPDKEDAKKWQEEEKKHVKQLYEIIKNVFEVEGEQAITIRKHAIDKGFYQTILERLHILTKQPKREHKQDSDDQSEDDVVPELAKKSSEQEYKMEVKKKKGIGYGTDSSSYQNWDISGHEEAKKEQSDQILGMVKILEKFISHPNFQLPKEILENTYNSALLPILESSLRGGSLLEISKNAELFKGQLDFIRVISRREQLIPCLMSIPKHYVPRQAESIFSLLQTLESTSKIFLSCLVGSVSEKVSEEIARNIIQVYNEVEEAISQYKTHHIDEEEDKRILELPLVKKYPILMKDLRFGYVDMKDKNGKMKHHYSSSYQPHHTSPAAKTIRLAQELADLSHALPIDHTNAIYVRCDKERVDFMQALIMGSNGTPYGHGAYLFDIQFEDSYPNNPPKVNLSTTGSGKIRFNPNLYNCGKVCLSLLGTWRGSAMENWDSKVSTLLQVLVSIQSIIMAEEVYFNEPGFEHEQGTVEGEKKNEAYSNIVRYGNIKFAMIDNIRNPPKGFETVIRRHFYLKKSEILEECKKWLKYAEKREASYQGLVSDHNNNWSQTFSSPKDSYPTMLKKAIAELEEELNKLPEPSAKDLIDQQKEKKKKANKSKKPEQAAKGTQEQSIEEIDVTYDKQSQSSAKQSNYKELDINDEKVKDRWSRYIGAMGIEAVNKQSKASVLQFGLGPLGIETAKNIVLSGCKRFSVCDEDAVTTWKDLSGQFYLNQEDIGKNRVEASLYKLQELNNYVRVDSQTIKLEKLQQDEQTQQKLKVYDVIIDTTHTLSQLFQLNSFCRKHNIKFISTKCEGPYGYIFNDFGDAFEVTDKNGQQTVECMIEHISNDEEGIVTLLEGVKHPYEDEQAVRITNVKGMSAIDQLDKVDEVVHGSINETIHRIKIVNKSCFKIGNTLKYKPYEGNGLVRNMKLPISIKFNSMESWMKEPKMGIDSSLEYYDFAKAVHNQTLHRCFISLSTFVERNKGRYPRPWNWEDSSEFLKCYQTLTNTSDEQQPSEIKYVRRFSFTCSGSFASLCAFYGGLIAQEVFKAITAKYMPINQYFLTDFSELIEELPEKLEEWQDHLQKKNYKEQEDRFEGLRVIVGEQLLNKIRNCRVFVIGSGAIGCELLKNYAMLNLSASEQPDKGEIIVTDPDHIENSNLNRQFLFREKHIQKPKSATATAVVKQMNHHLKNVKAKLLKICEETKDVFSNEFFESCDIVTNALDNVQARQYVDMRCVENKVPLLESGTLGSKGHVQVIIPYKTETYGSKADPAQEGEIPHCTLKMFPEQTLHCVEWARDIFGKEFTMKPKALMKIIQSINDYVPTFSETQMLRQCLQMLENKPHNFDDAVVMATKRFYEFYRNDIEQLLYTYPLDKKTKDGKDFWKLPKRPPKPVHQLDPKNDLHCQFIVSYAVLLSKTYNILYPKDFRSEARRKQITRQAMQIEVQPFVPSDKLAKEMTSEVENQELNQNEKTADQQENEQQESCEQLFAKIKQLLKEEKQISEQNAQISAEEFEKDEDSNGHVDLIHSMANLRAHNYCLEPLDWITTKLKAGRITPALSTTTSCIAGLQTIELIKYLAHLPLDQMRNTFLNLAVPIIQTVEPGEIEKIKIHEGLITNLWERWFIDDVNYDDITMLQLIKAIEDKYKITVITLSVAEGGPIYSDLVLGLESKKAEKQKFLKNKFSEVVTESESWEKQNNNFIDLSLVMAVNGEIIKHVPTVRVNFTK